ncbi:flippase [uncultured Selenomonas sp.]|uniref:flippase n=1 Tax=uncultured Selenomonas sp. TaxID=159275 RepID=UPI0028039BE9|nr:flippase [uncultured Selenomonas sp.]
MKNSVLRNYIYNLSYQILTLITPFITTPYLSRVLGPDGIGLYSYTTSIVSYFILLASMGVSDYAQREIAYHQNDRYIQSRTFFEVLGIRNVLVVISLVSYYLFLTQVESDHTIYWIQAINIIAVLFDITWFFQGLEEFGKIVARNFLVRIVNIVAIFVFIHNPSDLNLYIFLIGFMNVVSGLSIWLYLPKYLVHVERKDIRPFRNFLIIIQLFLPQIAIQIYTVLDKTMIGVITASPAQNGYYEQAEKIVKMTLMVVTSLGTVMIPRIASSYANGDIAMIRHYIMRSYRFVWLVALPMMFGLIGIIDQVIPWFFGPGYGPVGILVKVFSGLLLAIGINNVTGVQFLIPINKQNIFTLTVLIGAVLNFVLNLVLIPIFMSLGAAIASVTAETVIALVQFHFVKEYFSLIDVLSISIKYFLCSLIMFFVLEIVQFLMGYPSSILSTMSLVLIGCIIYGILLFIWKDSFFLETMEKILGKVRAKL